MTGISVSISPRLEPQTPLAIRFYVMPSRQLPGCAAFGANDYFEVNNISFFLTRDQTITLRDSLNALIELDPNPAPAQAAKEGK